VEKARLPDGTTHNGINRFAGAAAGKTPPEVENKRQGLALFAATGREQRGRKGTRWGGSRTEEDVCAEENK